MTDESIGFMRRAVHRLRDLFLPSSGLMIGDIRLISKKDANGNIDFFLKGEAGRELNLTGEVLFCRATNHLTLTTSPQSIVGDGDSTKVRLLLPTIGEWTVEAVFHFYVTATDPNGCYGELFVNDSGSAETGVAVFGVGAVDRGMVPQRWKVITTTANTSVELKARKPGAGGTASCRATHTTLTASIGAGGGTTVDTSDHGTLTGWGDDDHPQYGQVATAETIPGLWDFTGTVKVNVVASDGDIFLAPSGNINAGSSIIKNVTDPTLAQDAATKQYVDDNAAGTTDHQVLTNRDHAQAHLQYGRLVADEALSGVWDISNGIQFTEVAGEPGNPAENTATLYAIASGTDIILRLRSSQGVTCDICTLDDSAAAAHTNQLTLNWIQTP